MPQDANALVWMDLEMTGLDPETERIIEIATIITDSQLEIVAEGPVIVVRQPQSLLNRMDDWNTRTHTESGLVERVRRSSYSERQAEVDTLEFIQKHVPRNRSPLCGNSIYQDRRFLRRYMPDLEQWFHYRNLDVSTLKELVRRWAPALYEGLTKNNTHRALDDIRESIAELRYYREHFLRIPEARGSDPHPLGAARKC